MKLLELCCTVEVKQQGIADLAIRQDQRIFASAGWDSKIRVFSYGKCKALAILQVIDVKDWKAKLVSELHLLLSHSQGVSLCCSIIRRQSPHWRFISMISDYTQRQGMATSLHGKSSRPRACKQLVCDPDSVSRGTSDACRSLYHAKFKFILVRQHAARLLVL